MGGVLRPNSNLLPQCNALLAVVWRSNRATATAFPSELPPTAEAIRSVATEFSDEILEKLELLDQEFFAYPQDLTDLLFAYVSKNLEEFGKMPKPDDF